MSNLLKNLVGSDLRYIVVGGEVLFAIMRKNEKSFLSNITAGEPLLCEVNANPGNIELNEKLTGVNQAEAFTRYIVKEVYSI